ncbi:MAG: hypothetical protein K2W91_14130 [Novosphingobium sp.]|nr:hypothetical protein [Novosphingobium sp.]
MKLPAALIAVWALLAPGAVLAQQLGGGGSVEISGVRIVLALIVCLVVLALVLAVLRRKSLPKGLADKLRIGLGANGRIRTIESRRISPHADLCLVRCDDVEYLLVCTVGSVELLERRAAKPENQP